METIGRVLVAVFVIVMPSVLFLGLWRGLMRLRDDDLIEDLSEGDEPVRSPFDPSLGAKLFGLQGSSDDADDGTKRCVACGARNVGQARYCGHCLEQLDAR
jgi:hypothetical protein